MASCNDRILKSGWLFRKSDFLRRWKRSWVVIDCNGDLSYFESPRSGTAEDTIVLPLEVQRVLVGDKCNVSPPDGAPVDALFALETPEKTWEFCAENTDDRVAWTEAVASGRQVRPQPGRFSPPPAYTNGDSPYRRERVVYVENGRQVPAQVIYHPDGNTIVVYDDGRPPYCNRHSCYGCHSCCAGDAALGFATGALLFSPLMWWPMWY
ncbi:hypothetical protein BOX15_Mlig025598g2 [Macrostomum lignano]|uniref:PH domain-containing protein n=2 Tax=Macrostomum lignano TaxID=282301 RepID=A0A1I8FX81_9PLAT|nr:hypothetical protein BOX15_Mlig025598g2 [Macrostomum lignano]